MKWNKTKQRKKEMTKERKKQKGKEISLLPVGTWEVWNKTKASYSRHQSHESSVQRLSYEIKVMELEPTCASAFVAVDQLSKCLWRQYLCIGLSWLYVWN